MVQPKKGKKFERVRPSYKDGETPTQEWNGREVRAIRALANPAFASDVAAAKAARVTLARLRRWKRNPYFMNAVYELSKYMLEQYRVKVYKALVRQACRGSNADRVLFFRLVGDYREEKVVKKNVTARQTLVEGAPEEAAPFLDDTISRDVASFEDPAVRRLMGFSDGEGGSSK
jgi:hypothetical protein